MATDTEAIPYDVCCVALLNEQDVPPGKVPRGCKSGGEGCRPAGKHVVERQGRFDASPYILCEKHTTFSQAPPTRRGTLHPAFFPLHPAFSLKHAAGRADISYTLAIPQAQQTTLHEADPLLHYRNPSQRPFPRLLRLPLQSVRNP